ncbi:MAG: flavin prenyltransferase UbiX [Pseudomonadota bacterium]
MTNRIVVGICGASGSIYGIRLLKALLSQPWEVHLIISEAGKVVMAHELGFQDNSSFEQFLEREDVRFHEDARLIRHAPDDLLADSASGSFKHQGMVIAPCSMKTLAAVASGYATNLMERTADVCLKEKRPLVLVPRETPLNKIHLKNMIKAHNAGAIIMPPSPGFYFRPEAIDDLVDFIVARILDQLNIEHNLIGEWGNN